MPSSPPPKPASARSRVSTLVHLLRIPYGSVFIASGVLKMLDLSAFRASIEAFGLLPGEVTTLASLTIPIAEIFLGALILLNLRMPLGVQLILVLLVFFTAALVIKVFEGENINCGCFGNLTDGKINHFTILRNVGLIIWGVVLLSFYAGPMNEVGHESDNPRRLTFKRHLVASGQRILTHLIILFLAVVSIVLAIQNRSLKAQIAVLTRDLVSLKTGEVAQTFSAKTLDGVDTTITYRAESKTVLFVIRSTCMPCKQNVRAWEEIASHAVAEEASPLGIVLDTLAAVRRFVEENKPAFPVVFDPSGEFQAKYSILSTPHTILVVADTVLGVWRGELTPFMKAEILRQLAGR